MLALRVVLKDHPGVRMEDIEDQEPMLNAETSNLNISCWSSQAEILTLEGNNMRFWRQIL